MSITLPEFGRNPLTWLIQNREMKSKYEYYCNYLIEQDLSLKCGNQISKPLYCQFQKDYKLLNALRFDMVFPGIRDCGHIQFIFHDKLFNNGTLKFKLNPSET